MRNFSVILALFVLFLTISCKKKSESSPTPASPNQNNNNNTSMIEYGYFRGLIDGKSENYTAYLDDRTMFISALSNREIISSTQGVQSRFAFGNSISRRDLSFGITLSIGMLTPPVDQSMPTKQQFFDFFKLGKFPLVESGQNGVDGARVEFLEKNGDDYKFFENTVQGISDTAFVEFTKITTGLELGTPTVYYEAKLSATLIGESGAKKVIRNATMKGAFQPIGRIQE